MLPALTPSPGGWNLSTGGRSFDLNNFSILALHLEETLNGIFVREKEIDLWLRYFWGCFPGFSSHLQRMVDDDKKLKIGSIAVYRGGRGV